MPKETVLTCPQCGSDDLYPEMGFMTGYKYHCNNCDYVGPLVVERPLDEVREEAQAEADAEAQAGAEAEAEGSDAGD